MPRSPKTELADLIRSLDEDDRVHGILVQLPLPEHLDQDALISLIDPAKDVDGLTPLSAGLLTQGQQGAIAPCTPAGVMELLREAGVDLDGARAVLIGRSILVGKPLAALLLGRQRDGHPLPFPHPRARGSLPWGRRPDRGGGIAGAWSRRRDGQPGGGGDRRRHQSRGVGPCR